ncbi:MAG: hypothetical protein DU430_08225 [Candidatus Tokpelaia sp.]|nr:MAG: hypothetical protein DU430_08225 [Candidatus Tokpelaia sp.]
MLWQDSRGCGSLSAEGRRLLQTAVKGADNFRRCRRQPLCCGGAASACLCRVWLSLLWGRVARHGRGQCCYRPAIALLPLMRAPPAQAGGHVAVARWRQARRQRAGLNGRAGQDDALFLLRTRLFARQKSFMLAFLRSLEHNMQALLAN